jgi:serine protease Do
MFFAAAAAAALTAGFVAVPTLLSPPAQAQRIEAPAMAPPMGAPGSFANLIDRVSPAVVSIDVKMKVTQEEAGQEIPPEMEEFLRRFGMPPRGEQQRRPRSTEAQGSGFFISETGVVVTNNHVVENATDITVKLSDGRELKADIVGRDDETDLAVLRIRGGGRFPYVEFDRDASKRVRVGDWVVAVGNPFGLEGTATAGIVSAKGRRQGGSYVDFMQIDAPINRGNSGGPSFDLQGRVIGVNSAIYSRSGDNAGIGFAIPADTAATVVDTLLSQGRISRGYLGVQVQPVDEVMAKSLGLPEAKGALVSNVTPDTPASKAGLKEGDLIVSINGAQVEDQRDLTRKIGGLTVGKPARLDYLRDGRRQTTSVVLAERPTTQQLAGLDRSGRMPPRDAPTQPQKATALGMELRAITAQDRERLDMAETTVGLIIDDVDDDSPLTRQGVRAGMVIVAAEGRPVRTIADLNTAIAAARKASKPVMLQFETRNNRRFFAAVDPGQS